tara:strand:+ start:803 stop:1135 length:333 start_codon:yes stop_codon:yes gene_type:complete
MTNKKKRRKKLYPHNWAIYKQLPAEVFEPLPFDVFMQWKVDGWMLPDNVYCIIRTTNKVTKKVKEYVYKIPFYAERKIHVLASNPLFETFVTTHYEQRRYINVGDEFLDF